MRYGFIPFWLLCGYWAGYNALTLLPWPWSHFLHGPDSNIDRKSWNERLGKCDFTLAFMLLLNIRSSSGDLSHLSLRSLPSPRSFISSVRDFTSWMIWGSTGEESSAFFSHSTELASILLKHGQYDAVEVCLYAFNFLWWESFSFFPFLLFLCEFYWN